MVFRLSAASRSLARPKYSARYASPSRAIAPLSSRECSSRSPGVGARRGAGVFDHERFERMPRSAAVFARPGGRAQAATTAPTTAISTATDDEALPREDRVAERDEPPGTRPPCRDDVADLRLQRARRRHLQRRRAAEALRPDAARGRGSSPPRARGSRRLRTRRAISLASTALKMRLKPQLNHALAIAKTATSATAPRGDRGHARERARSAVPRAATWRARGR